GTRNVPMNEHLATLEPTSDEAARYWPHYGSRWTAWNHLRTAACLLASAWLVIALSWGAAG
ncbi:MAG: anthrone oxygenase family protein, partial [Planctomycetota bacterium]